MKMSGGTTPDFDISDFNLVIFTSKGLQGFLTRF